MKRVLGLDIGTNSIGWSLIEDNRDVFKGEILGLGSRIIPMTQDSIKDFNIGNSSSKTKDRTFSRGVRRLYQRDNLRRERLHRVLHILGFLPQHYADAIDFDKRLGQFKEHTEEKINYKKNEHGKYEFLFHDSYQEMLTDFRKHQPSLFYTKANGEESKIPYDWTIYYLRKKALTKAISKEELAWLILHFNQKRGYYQARGDEESDSNKEYVELEVKELIPTGEQVKGTEKYEVLFTNGWLYITPIKDTQNWIGRTKEFIVTSKKLKDGSIKRTYKAVDKKADWLAIKTKTEQDIEKFDGTVGTYIYDVLLQNPNQKVRGSLVKTIERKYYKEELAQLLATQIRLQPTLFTSALYDACLYELYPNNEAHRKNILSKGFNYFFVEDIIFYHRPLKSQKSNIANCPFEYTVYKQQDKENNTIQVQKPLKSVPKSHPLFQEFRLWQWLANLKIFAKEKIIDGKSAFDIDITAEVFSTEEDIENLFDYLMTKADISQDQMISYLIAQKKISKKDKDNYRWNYVQEKKYPCAETRASFINRLKKVNGIDPISFLAQKDTVGNQAMTKEEQLWHIIYSVTDFHEYKKALAKFAKKCAIDEQTFVQSFLKYPPFDSNYGSYSLKAIKKLISLMRVGKYWQQNQIHPETLGRIEKIINGEYDEKIRDRVREKTIALQQLEDFQGLPLWLASYVIYDRHAENTQQNTWTKAKDIEGFLEGFKQHSLRNPIVEQVVTETLRVVRDIWQYYGEGKKDFFDEIHVELGREMKNPADKRKKITDKVTENENTNYRIKKILEELKRDTSIEGDIRPYSSSQQEKLRVFEEGIIQNPNVAYGSVSEEDIDSIRKTLNPSATQINKYKLWLEQQYISPYTGKPIPLSKLFTKAYEIEHIIPQSRFFDNSLTNKVICETAVNSHKSNKTAYEYIKQNSGAIVDGHTLFTLEAYEEHVGEFFKKNINKRKNLLSEDVPEQFINRQLNDTRYISKYVMCLLKRIVQTPEEEQEAGSKNLIAVTGAVTAKLKKDWGLNDQWNEIISPRFKRLNQLTNSSDYGYWDEKIKAFRTQVPDQIAKGFTKKRIDHRHHALDALVIACTTRTHILYLHSLNNQKVKYELQPSLMVKNKEGHFTKRFLKPWDRFTVQAKEELQKVVVSFKQNTRVINKTTNYFWSYRDEEGKLNLSKDGKPMKKLRKQTKGDSWAIRKSLHKATVAGLVKKDEKGKNITFTRKSLSSIKSQKDIDKIVDKRIREVILPNHMQNYQSKDGKVNFGEAFSPEGIQNLNQNIVSFNKGKKHHPIYKVGVEETGSKFSIGTKANKASKYVEAAKDTNLFFAIYWNEQKKKRTYETVPLHEVIAHQKQVAHLPASDRIPIQPKAAYGTFLFTLSPNDLVYVPTDEELDNPSLVNFQDLLPEQVDRIYKMVSSTSNECYFIKNNVATLIKRYDKKSKIGEFGSMNKLEKTIEIESPYVIKERCWKLKVNRLGMIKKT